MPFSQALISYQLFLLLSCTVVMACSSKKEEQQIRTLLQQSDSILWQSKSEAKVYAQQAYDKATVLKTAGLQAQSMLRLANAVRVNGKLSVLLGYDSTAVALARESKDSVALFNALNAYAKDLLMLNELTKADTLLKEEEALCRRLGNDSSFYQAKYLNTYALRSFKASKPEEAKQHYETSLRLAEKKGDEYLANQNRVKIFSANQYLGIRDTTAKLALDAVDYFRRNHRLEDEANALFTIGENYRYIGNTQKAKAYYLKAQQVLTDNLLISFSLSNSLFIINMSRQKADSAFVAITTMDKYADIMAYETGKGFTQVNWGLFYTETGEFSKAESAFNLADSFALVTGVPQLGIMTTMYRAALYDKQHKVKESDSAALLGYGAIQRMVSPKLIKSTNTTKDGKRYNSEEEKLMLDSTYLRDSGQAYLNKTRSQNDSAEEPIYKPLLSAFDSSTSISFSRQADEIEAQYKIRIYEDSIRLQQQLTLIDKADLKTRNITLVATAALLLLVTTGGFLQYRSRQRAVRDKQRIELLQNEIHHRVKNNLAVINRLVEVAGKNSVEDAPLASLKNRIKSIELLHNHLYSREAAVGNIALQPYLNDLCLAIAATFHSAKNIAISVDAPAEVDSAIAEKLGLIVNELVTNSYKYAFENREAGNVNIIARQQKGTLSLSVADDGIGLPEATARNSYGMKLIKGLSHEIKGRFQFLNSNGTRFEITLPVAA